MTVFVLYVKACVLWHHAYVSTLRLLIAVLPNIIDEQLKISKKSIRLFHEKFATVNSNVIEVLPLSVEQAKHMGNKAHTEMYGWNGCM